MAKIVFKNHCTLICTLFCRVWLCTQDNTRANCSVKLGYSTKVIYTVYTLFFQAHKVIHMHRIVCIAHYSAKLGNVVNTQGNTNTHSTSLGYALKAILYSVQCTYAQCCTLFCKAWLCSVSVCTNGNTDMHIVL